MNEILDTLTKALLPLLIAVLTAAAGVAIAWLNAMKRKHDLDYQQSLTRAAVAATDQTMPDATNADKLDNTVSLLGKYADTMQIEAEVKDRKEWAKFDASKKAEPYVGGMEASCGE
jgi:membrane protein required for beta-lactamase induction